MIQYRKEIDGLRALAVTGVLLFHLQESGAVTGGWLGVDIFFVISGYLICSLLFKEIAETGSISLAGFYQRRVRRILPALLLCLMGSFPIAFLISDTYLFTQYSQSLAAALFSCSNIFFWQHSGYFAVDAQLAPLLHTWTLGVEEQFYIVIPVLFLLLSRLRDRKRAAFFAGMLLIAAASFWICRYGKEFFSLGFRFYMLPARMWELMIGMFTALLLFHRPGVRRCTPVTELLSAAALAFLCFAFVHYTGGSHFAEKAFFTAMASAVFLATASEATLAGRLLSLGPIRFVGNISYSLYLWHWPVIFIWNLMMLRFDLKPSPEGRLAVILASVVMATLSWRFVEKPFRRKATWKACRPLLIPALLVLVLAGAGHQWFGGGKTAFAVDEGGRADFSSFKDIEQGRYFPMGPEGAPRFILIGDSHAQAISTALMDLAQEYGVPGAAGMKDGTGPLPTIRRSHKKDDPPFARRWLHHLLEAKIENVVLIAKWDRYYYPDLWDYRGSRPAWDEATAMAELRDYVRQLLDAGCQVWILDEVPHFDKDPIVMTKLLDNIPFTERVDGREKTHFASRALAGIDSPRLHLLNPYPVLAPEGRLESVRDGAFLYVDTNHVTSAGARALKPLFRPLFEAARRTGN